MESIILNITIGLCAALSGFYIGSLYKRVQLYNALQKTISNLEQNIVNLLKEVKEANVMESESNSFQKTDGLIGDFDQKDLLQFSLKMAVMKEDYKGAAFIRDIIRMKYGEDSNFE
tara:strand:+ start:1117 stop:1464 length:348 start_codon:yes stop_codon:yes gene_type:complete